MSISDWSSDVCSSDLARIIFHAEPDTLAPAYSQHGLYPELYWTRVKFLKSMITDHWSSASDNARVSSVVTPVPTGESGTHGDTNSDLPTPRQTAEWQVWAKDATVRGVIRSEEYTSQLNTRMRISSDYYCLNKKS